MTESSDGEEVFPLYLAPHQHELRHRLLAPQRAAVRPARIAAPERRARRRRLLSAVRARFA